MTDLPTLTVTEAQAAILLDGFPLDDDYRAWLRDRLIDRALEREQKRMAAEALTQQRDALAALRAKLT